MNKFMLKISTILLGAFMSIGAGVAMAGINDRAEKANAIDTTTATYTQTSTTAAKGTSAPDGSSVTFNNTYSTKEQMTSGKSQTWTFSGYENYKISSIVLSLKRNSSKGAGKLDIKHGSESIVTKTYAINDLTSSYAYYEVYKNDNGLAINSNIVITISATQNSLYCNRVDIKWQPATVTPIEDNFVIDEDSTTSKIARGNSGVIVLKDLTGDSKVTVAAFTPSDGDASSYISIDAFDEAHNKFTFRVASNTPIGDEYYFVVTKGTKEEMAIFNVYLSDDEVLTLNYGASLEIEPNANATYNFVARFNGAEVASSNITWSISNETFDTEKAKVQINESGELKTDCKADATGSFVVTATHKTFTYMDGSALSASCLVKFKTSEPYLEADTDELEMFVGDERSVTVTAYNFTADTEINVTVVGEEAGGDLCGYEVKSTEQYNVKTIVFSANYVGKQNYTITLSNGTQTLSVKVIISVDEDKIKTLVWNNIPTIELNQRQELTWDHLTGEVVATYASSKTENVELSMCDVLVNGVDVTLPYIVKTTDNAVSLEYNGKSVSGTAILKVTPLTLVSGSAIQGYKKVTEELTDWTGTYLIGYEASATQLYAMKGEDGVSNYIASTIKDDIVEESSNLVPAIITKKGTTYSIKIGDNYIYQTTNANGLKTSTTENSNNEISYNSSTKSITIICGGAYLRFNANSGQTRFRYFKSGSYSSQKAIQLYKHMDGKTYEVSDSIYDFVNTVSATFTCSSEHDLSSESLTNLQTTLSNEYTKLTDEDKAILKSANANEAGNFIEAFLSRYDYIVGKYDAISNVLERNVITTTRSAFMASRNAKRANSMLLVVGLVGISLISYGIYSLTKKKEEK